MQRIFGKIAVSCVFVVKKNEKFVVELPDLLQIKFKLMFQGTFVKE